MVSAPGEEGQPQPEGWQENPWCPPEHQLSWRVRGSGITNDCVHCHASSWTCNTPRAEDTTTCLLERGDHASAENGIYTAILRIRCLCNVKDLHLTTHIFKHAYNGRGKGQHMSLKTNSKSITSKNSCDRLETWPRSDAIKILATRYKREECCT